MAQSKSRAQSESQEKAGLFAKLSLFFYNNRIFTATLMLILFVAGTLSYTSWLRREGFPPVDVPFAIATGTYFVDDAEKVDEDVARPLGDLAGDIEGFESVTTFSDANFFSIQAELGDELTNAKGNELLQEAIDSSGIVPDGVEIDYVSIDAAKFIGEYDILVSLYGPAGTDPGVLEQAAQDIATQFETSEIISSAAAEPLFSSGLNRFTGEQETQQTSYGRFGIRSEDGSFSYFDSTVIGVTGVTGDDLDIFELSEEVKTRIDELSSQLPEGLQMQASADFTDAIENQISSLESNVLTGLIAVTLISALMISWRVSILTAVFMVSVIFVTMLILLLAGQTLNTITLFALVLALGLFVDDATIISEAIDAAKDPKLSRKEIVKRAINSVGAASFAGTLTTILVFAPLLFITGILGEFIFFLPFTVILALSVSLVLSLTLIPFLSHYLVLTKNNMTKEPWNNPVPEILGNMIMKLKTNKKVGVPWAVGMFTLSLVFFVLAGSYFSRLSFNIFPPSKDSDELGIVIDYDPGTTIEQAEDISDVVNRIVETVVGEELVKVTYAGDSLPTTRSAVARIELTPFTEREIKSPTIITKLENSLETLGGASTQIIQLDAGPPAEEFPFRLQVFGDEIETLVPASNDIAGFLDGREIERLNGTSATITQTDTDNTESVVRKDGRRFVEVLAAYDADDVSALVQTTRDVVNEEYDEETLSGIGLESNALEFDFGQESENEESFSALGPAGLASVAIMLVLLIFQFRSVLKPILIFLAMPFSFLGVGFGLYISDNPLSFFAMIGFIGLIGIAVNNTILLVDAANQERRRGKSTTESIAIATRKRFRPLFTTTATTVAALAPLAMSDPFWEPLAITIMFGLLSSTVLVILSFPFYYIAADASATWTMGKLKRLFKRA